MPIKRSKLTLPYNMQLIQFTIAIVLIVTSSGFLLSARASYLYEISRATEEINQDILNMGLKNDSINVEIERLTSLEVVMQKALKLGFDKPQSHQIYQIPVVKWEKE